MHVEGCINAIDKMRIAINAHFLAYDKTFRNAGVSNYLHNLIDNLSYIDKENQYYIFVHKDVMEYGLKKENLVYNATSFNTTKPIVRIFWEQFVLPIELIRNKIDVFHGPMAVIPFLFLI